MENMRDMDRESLLRLEADLRRQYGAYQEKGLKLDMSRGKPSPEQLDLSAGLLDMLDSRSDIHCAGGADTRNYGMLDGIPEAKKLFAGLLGVEPDMVVVGGSSSLNLMYDCIVRGLLLGVYGARAPWGAQGHERLRFLCPVPGYDRHFAVTEQFGFDMIPIPMNSEGPDMDEVERLAASDAAVKGIWCVPKYSNPNGVVYSDETVRRFARLAPAADDFRIFWDNAYAVHDLYPEKDVRLLNIFDECEDADAEDRIYAFTSTSKISYSGGGLSCLAASPRNVAHIKKQMGYQTIGYDKVNQLRHVKFYRDQERVLRHMAAQADIIRPKFEAVLRTFDAELTGSGAAEWTRPLGGYFISVDVMPGCAKRTVELCREAGVALTGAGAAYPYGRDPQDSNIRIAPTYPEIEDLSLAARLFCLCLKRAAAEKLLDRPRE